MDATERRFLTEIGRAPDDAQLREVYADWLEERGETAKATFLRAQLGIRRTMPIGGADDPEVVAHLQQLEATYAITDAIWRAQVADTRLENCTVAVRCPKTWDALAATDRPGVRSCGTCRRDVYYCTTAEELAEHAPLGHCIAVDPVLPRWPPERHVMMGVVAPRPDFVDRKVPDPPPPKPLGLWSRLWGKLRRS
jgi:uncharacterized protein (TIGR02996 family)